jgi:hypothetical protein
VAEYNLLLIPTTLTADVDTLRKLCELNGLLYHERAKAENRPASVTFVGFPSTVRLFTFSGAEWAASSGTALHLAVPVRVTRVRISEETIRFFLSPPHLKSIYA